MMMTLVAAWLASMMMALVMALIGAAAARRAENRWWRPEQRCAVHRFLIIFTRSFYTPSLVLPFFMLYDD